ncbi:MAG TPA: septum formation initiator family protein [Acidimicrobiales bacterium]|nr:septum formation initiator family protein [Acidimicrobiales bacterium]|tara:strand:+ start:744 stop:1061 length:318 start_codon:yes stop_codon:yes gene_type:complete
MSARFLVPFGAVIIVVGITLAFGIDPFSDWLDQRSDSTSLQSQVDEVERRNKEYELLIDALNTDEEIERKAREEYNLVRPEEEAYAVLPPPPAVHRIKGVWPFNN